MAVYTKAKSSENVKEGGATVCTGVRTQLYQPAGVGRDVANVDALGHVVALDSKFKTDPSGWSA